MSQPEHYDVLILGSGGGGKLTAWHNGQSGRRTAVVERKWIGGSCPNIACLPSKNEIHSAEAAHFARNGAEFGVMTGPVKVDMAKVVQRKRDMVERLVAAHLKNYNESGAELVMGDGRFVAPKTLEVSLNDGGTRTLTGTQVFINVGTHAAIPNIPGLEAAKPLTHIEALELDILPAHLIVIGGGYSGLELAQAYRRFGAEVTVVEAGPQLMGREDADASQEIRRILSATKAFKSTFAAELVKVSGQSGRPRSASRSARATANKRSRAAISLSRPAASRTPPASGSTKPASSSPIAVSSRSTSGWRRALRTSGRSANAPAARCSPTYPKTTFASFATISPAGSRNTRDRFIPYCMFTDPPLAHVGLSEREAERQGVKTRVARLPMKAVLRAQATGQTEGFMKALVGESDDRILGFTMIGAEAGEVLAVVQTAMMADLPYTRLRDADFTHPTFSEGLNFLFSNTPPRSSQ